MPGRRVLAVKHVIGRFLGPVDDVRDITQKDGPVAKRSDDDVADILGRRQKLPRFHDRFAIARRQLAGHLLPVGLLQHRDDRGRRHVSGRHFGVIEQDADLPPLAADQLDLRNVRYLLDLVSDLGRDTAYREMVVLTARQRQGQDRHIVDRTRLDERRRRARRDHIQIGVHFLVEPDDRVFFVLADLEPHDRHRHSWRRRRINVLDARYLPQELFHRARYAFFDLF